MSGVITNRYSEAFKLKVVEEIEQGKYSISDSMRVYGVNGGQTISNWIKKYRKGKEINKIVRIEMRGEKDRIKELEKEKRELEKALAKTQLRALAMEALVDIGKEEYGIDLKKNGLKGLKE